MTQSSDKLWSGRFSQKTHVSVEAFTSSIQTDKRLYAFDIQGSVAHCKMLAKASIITEDEAFQLIEGLGRIKRAIDHKEFEFNDSLEDIHMHIENALLQDVGKVALKLHTARSRNDQIALDARMYLRDAVQTIIKRLHAMQKALVALAKKHTDIVLPGYTHMQRAQPVLLAHHLLAYYEMFDRDIERFGDCLERINVMPLGSAALAGTTYPIDQQYTAELLGFPKIASNSLDAVSDRDFMVEFLANASLCMVHFSRLAEELVLWSSAEFGFIEIADAFATGSSIMPQKKNPDVPELMRGKTGRVFGGLMGMLTLLKGLPLSYNRDLQEDKDLLFDAVDTLNAVIEVCTQLIPGLKFNAAAMRKAASAGFLDATDMADYLVSKGMAFRDAHHCVGGAVSYALENNKELRQLTLEELQKFSKLIETDVYDSLSLGQMIERRTSHGGTATQNVKAAIRAAEIKLEGAGEHLNA